MPAVSTGFARQSADQLSRTEPAKANHIARRKQASNQATNQGKEAKRHYAKPTCLQSCIKPTLAGLEGIPRYDELPQQASSSPKPMQPSQCSQATEPNRTQPNPTDPNRTQPNPTEPNRTQPNPTEPNRTQPNPTEPTHTNRTQTHPNSPKATHPHSIAPNASASRQITHQPTNPSTLPTPSNRQTVSSYPPLNLAKTNLKAYLQAPRRNRSSLASG